MKFLLFLLFTVTISLNVFGQLEYRDVWYLHSMEIDGTSYPAPSNTDLEEIPATFFDYDVFVFWTTACDFLAGNLNLGPGSDEFSLSDLQQASNNGCDLAENTSFQNLYFDFYFSNEENTFSFVFNQVENTLTIININGDSVVYGDPVLSINNFIVDSITLYPNPVSDQLFIISENHIIETIIIYSSLGKKIVEIENIENSIDVSHLSEGIYFIEVTTSEGKSVQKFIKK